jgi:hypothetical protein
MFEDTILLICSEKLFSNDYVSLLTSTDVGDGSIILPLTSEQRRVYSLVDAVIISHHSVAIFDKSGSGNIYFIRSFAQIIGIPLEIIQFNSDTDSSPIIDSLEIDGNIENDQSF